MTNSELEWIEPTPVDPSPDLLEAAGSRVLLAQILQKRGIESKEAARRYLNPCFTSLADPFDLPDMVAAIDLIEKAIKERDLIGIWGDFDVDGQTATALLTSTIQSLGGRSIYHIPVRQKESHGVNLAGLDNLIRRGSRLILTCDTGISAFEAALHAQESGVPFIITDHHSLPESLPLAQAVINPGRLNPAHPLSTLCGVGVAYELATALFQLFKQEEKVIGL